MDQYRRGTWALSVQAFRPCPNKGLHSSRDQRSGLFLASSPDGFLTRRTAMRLKTLVAVAVAAAFAVPLLSQAQSDKPAAGATTPGSTMDKNKDGSISREEAKGTPFEKDFSKLDKDGDGKLSASEQADAKAGAGATGESKAPK
jgi:EF hand